MSDEIKIHCSYDQMVNVEDLREHPKNNNKHTKEQLERLVKVIKANGFRRVITVSRNSGFMTAGHLRLLAAKELGMRQVPVNFQHYDNDDLEYADLTADNALQEWSELDLSAINSEIGNFDPSFDIDLLGIKGFTLDFLADEILEDEEKSLDQEKENVIVISFDSEKEMKELYEELVTRGFNCKLIV